VLKLYMHPLSTFSRRVAVALVEKNIRHEVVLVDLRERKHREPAYLSLNPYGRVPTLVDGDFVLYESTAVLNYLEAIHPQPPLVPDSPQGRALVDMHMKLCDVQLTRYAGTITFAKRFLPKEKWDLAAMDQARGEINRHLAVLGSQLDGRQYLVEDRFSLAEVCYAPFVHFFELMEVSMPPAVTDWAARILARPSMEQTKPSL
jgi:glutathione S-transferase